MIRSTVFGALGVLKCGKDQVARLRSSQRELDGFQVAHLPTRMMSGVFAEIGLAARFRERQGMDAHIPADSRGIFFVLWMNSIGSSLVMMWLRMCLFQNIAMEDQVVDLPDPVGPSQGSAPFPGRRDVARPEACRAFPIGMIVVGMFRKTGQAPRFWTKTLTRNSGDVAQ